MDEENNELDEMQEERQKSLMEKSGKEALKKQQKKDSTKKAISVIIKTIVAKIQLILAITLITSLITIIFVSVITAILGGSASKNTILEENMNTETHALTLQQYLVQFSHSGEAPQSDDGKFYKMYGDGVGWPTIGNSDLQWKAHQAKFAVKGKVLKPTGENTESNVQDYVNGFLTRGANAKYSNSEIANMGIYIEKELVDSVRTNSCRNILSDSTNDNQRFKFITAAIVCINNNSIQLWAFADKKWIHL